MKNINVNISFECADSDELNKALTRLSGVVDQPKIELKEPEATVVETKETPAPPPVPETPQAPTPTPAPAPAPTETKTEDLAPVGGVELDSAGLPWDARINASTKTKLKKTGEWKVIRGCDPALVESVKAELRAVMALPVTSTTPAPVATAPTPAPTPTPVPQPTPETPAPTNTGPLIVNTFPEFMQEITRRGLDAETVTRACQTQGLPSPTLVAARPELIPAICQVLFV